MEAGAASLSTLPPWPLHCSEEGRLDLASGGVRIAGCKCKCKVRWQAECVRRGLSDESVSSSFDYLRAYSQASLPLACCTSSARCKGFAIHRSQSVHLFTPYSVPRLH